MSDLWTMIWKEAKDSLLQGGREAWVRPLIMIGFLGLFLPWQLKQSWLALSPAAMLLILALPFLFIFLFVGDAIAGERERHTLETLLASRISGRAILLGKTVVMAGTAWGMALLSLLLGLLSANLASGQGRWAFYGSFDLLVEALTLCLLTSLLATSVGVLISLRSATVRQAQQRVMVVMLVLLVGVAVVVAVLPKQAVSALSAEEIWLIALVVLAVLDTIVLGVLRVRFRRSHVLFS